MKKFLYLDIDGVLCLGSETKPKNTKWGFVYPFNKGAVKVLNEVLEKTNPDIIISSDWGNANNFTLEQLQGIFEWQGVIKKPVSITPKVEKTNIQFLERDRAKEIKFHVDIFQPDIWVAVDDLPLHEWWTEELISSKRWQDYKEDMHFVYCPRWYEGIKQSGIKEELIKKLTL